MIEKVKSTHEKQILRATCFALAVSCVLAIAKFGNYFITGSVAIHGSALDSLMDISVSFANFITIKLIQRKATSKFPYGFDKIAALIAFLQAILVAVLAFMLIKEGFEKFLGNESHVHSFGLGALIIVFALILNTALVAYQSKVVKRTGSLVIKADMLHYKTDFFTNSAILVGLLAVWAFDVHWLDPLVGIISGVYLFYAIYSLVVASLRALLDMNNPSVKLSVLKFLKQYDVKINDDDVSVLFSGTKFRIKIKSNNVNKDVIKLLNKEYSSSSIEIIQS